MKITKILTPALCTGLLCANAAFAGGPGTSAVATLKLDGAARPLALGGAYVAVADDASAVFYNPAGIAQLDRKQLLLTHTEWLAGMRTEYLAYAHPLSSKLTLGAGANFSFVDGVAEYDTAGNKAGSFGANEGYGLVNVAYRPLENLALGLSGKYIRQQVSSKQATAYAFDLGFIYYTRLFRLGAAVQNTAGGKMELATEEFSLPATVRGGITLTPLDALLVTAEYVKPNDEDTSLRMGAEYAFEFTTGAEESTYVIPVRAGWRTGQSDGAGPGFAAGVGFNMNDVSFDYAFMPYGDLGNAHKLTLALKFGALRDGAPDTAKKRKKTAQAYRYGQS